MSTCFDSVPALPQATGTVLHESSRMHTRTNRNADGLTLTTLATTHLRLWVDGGELRVRFVAYLARRAAVLPERPRRGRVGR